LTFSIGTSKRIDTGKEWKGRWIERRWEKRQKKRKGGVAGTCGRSIAGGTAAERGSGMAERVGKREKRRVNSKEERYSPGGEGGRKGVKKEREEEVGGG